MRIAFRALLATTVIAVLAACGDRQSQDFSPSDYVVDTMTVAARATGSSTILVTWPQPKNAIAQYAIARNGNAVGTVSGTVSTLAFTDTGLTPATTYTYSVTGINPSNITGAVSRPTSATTFSLSVGKVTVTPATPSVLVGQTVQLAATTADSAGQVLNGLPITWTSANPSIATVSSSGLVTGAAVGSATISATSEGITGQLVVTVSATPVATVVVAPATASVSVGQTVQFTGTAEATGGAVLAGRSMAWSAGDTTIAVIGPTGIAVGRKAGSTTITATSSGKSGQATLTVTSATVASVSVSPSTPSLATGTTVSLTATPKDGSGNALTGFQVTWASGDTTIAKVSAAGVVSGVAPGSIAITATCQGIVGTATVTVTPASIASITVTPPTISIAVGGLSPLTAVLKDALGNILSGRVVTWTSNNTGVATVNSLGVVAGVSVGSATITAAAGGQTAAAQVTVTAVPVASVTLSPTTVSLNVGQTAQFTATPKDASGNVLNGRVVAWSSSDSTVAGVNLGGLLTAILPGTSTVTATVEGVHATATANVHLVPVAHVTIAPSTLGLTVGLTAQLTATATDSVGNVLTGRPVTWSSDAPALASVSATGVVSGLAAGLVHVTASIGGVNATATVNLSLPITPPADTFFACAADSVAATTTATIGALGGTIHFGHHTLFIPPASVLTSTSITATELGDGHVDAQFSPEGLQLVLPATLTLSYGNCSEAVKGTPVIDYLSGPLGQILQQLLTTVNQQAHTVTAPITHFSVYIMAE